MLIKPGGGKLWRWKYRFDGAEKLMAFGRYPEVSLSDARERRDAARKKLANGVDPMAERMAEKTAVIVAILLFGLLVDAYGKSRPRTNQRVEAVFPSPSTCLVSLFFAGSIQAGQTRRGLVSNLT